MEQKRTINVKSDTLDLTIIFPNGKKLSITCWDNGILLCHTFLSDINKVVIGAGDTSFKVTEINENESVYAIEKVV